MPGAPAARKSRGGLPPPYSRSSHGWRAGTGARFPADTTGAGRADIVGLKTAKGAVTSSGAGDGTFDDERVPRRPAPSPSPADLSTLADTTGDGRLDLFGRHDDVWVPLQNEDGTFAPIADEPVLPHAPPRRPVIGAPAPARRRRPFARLKGA